MRRQIYTNPTQVQQKLFPGLPEQKEARRKKPSPAQPDEKALDKLAQLATRRARDSESVRYKFDKAGWERLLTSCANAVSRPTWLTDKLIIELRTDATYRNTYLGSFKKYLYERAHEIWSTTRHDKRLQARADYRGNPAVIEYRSYPDLKKQQREYARQIRRHLEKAEQKGTIHELRRKIRNKVFAREIALNLYNSNAYSPLRKSYLNTAYYCQHEYYQEGYKLRSTYCNNRHCYACNRIRTGKLINNYYPLLERIQHDIYMVTLTAPTVHGSELRHEIRRRIECFQKIAKRFQKQKERDKRGPFVGLRKLECTQTKGKFHPHLHVLVKGQSHAEDLRAAWLDLNPDASVVANNIRKADINSCKELFKYFAKFWSTASERKQQRVDYRGLDTIFTAMRGLRVFQPFGLKHLKLELDESEDVEVEYSKLYNVTYNDKATWNYVQELRDYVNTEDGNILAGYVMSRKDTSLLTSFLAPDIVAKPPPE